MSSSMTPQEQRKLEGGALSPRRNYGDGSTAAAAAAAATAAPPLQPLTSNNVRAGMIKRSTAARITRHGLSQNNPTDIPDTKDDHINEDIENQSNTRRNISLGNQRSDSQSNPPLSAAILHLKVLLSKILSTDDKTIMREDTPTAIIAITLMKDFLFGFLVTFSLWSLFVFIDRIFLLHLSSNRNFRNAAHMAATNPSTTQLLEKETGLKIMDMELYEKQMGEINGASEKIQKVKNKLDEYTRLVEERKQQFKSHKRIMKEFGLDQFCDDCPWFPESRIDSKLDDSSKLGFVGDPTKSNITCKRRMKMLQDHYDIPKFEAMLSTMNSGSCKINKDVVTSWEQLMSVRKVMEEWDVHSKNYCGDCFRVNKGETSRPLPNETNSSSNAKTCDDHARLLFKQHAIPIMESMATIMVTHEECRKNYYRTKIKKMGGFCDTCVWGVQGNEKENQSCGRRVDYLANVDHKPILQAKLEVMMEKKSCIFS